MAADNNHDSKTGLIPILVLIMLATGTLINPLTSSRPHDPQYTKLLSSDVHKVDARLWQDPIAAVERHTNQNKESKEKPPTKSIDGFRKEIEEKVQNDTDLRDLRIIAISVFGSSYPELTEFRQRYRYAVVSALGARGYSAQDTEHLNFIPLESEQASDKPKIIDVPYEWFESDSKSELSNKKRVLILWLNEDKILPEKYGNFIKDLFNELKKIQSRQFDFSVIGPTTTSLLVELIKQKEIDNLPPPFKIISSSATISDSDLFDAIEKNNDRCSQKKADKEKNKECVKEEITKKLAEKSIIRTIGQDENLAKALLWELEQRGINSKNTFAQNKCEDGIVLISERDTLYARALTGHFDKLLKERCPVDSKGLVTNFTYLRGLDGKLPDLDDSNKKSSSENDNKEQKNLITQLDDAPPEHAEGRNQFDYLRRLTNTIEQLDRKQGLGTNRIKAIGIIGTDVYDKLLILQALKDRFKHKIFFTTELDARYLHADQKKWTRNLVVASNFDFTLRPKLQGTTMPFRDSYQTSMYFATLLALNFPTIESDNWVQLWINERSTESQKLQLIEQIQQDQKKLDGFLKPQIFEIGRTQAIHLASPPVDDPDKWVKNEARSVNEKPVNDSDCSIENVLACLTIEPDRTKQIDWATICITLILLLFVAYISWGFFKVDREKIRLTHIVVTLLPVFLLLFLICLIYIDNFLTHADGEPFLLFEGISVWPNLVIRTAGIIVMILLFTCLFRPRREREIEAIEKKFGLCKTTCLRSWQEAVWRGPFLNFTDAKKARITYLWLEYKRIIQYKESKGYLWVFLVSTISLGFTLYAFWGLGYLNFPARGVITINVHYILVTVQFLILWGLIFWVAYEAIACKQFIEGIELDQTNSNKTVWLPEMLKQQIIMTGLPIDKLNPYLHFVLITKLVKSINSIIYLPFVLMLIIAIGRSNIFDNLGFSPALIVVYILASAYLITILYLLRKSAEKQCGMVLQYYEDYRLRLAAISSRELGKADNLLTEIRNAKQSTFVPFLQRPALLALLLPGGGIGLTSIVEYLYN